MNAIPPDRLSKRPPGVANGRYRFGVFPKPPGLPDGFITQCIMYCTSLSITTIPFTEWWNPFSFISYECDPSRSLVEPSARGCEREGPVRLLFLSTLWPWGSPTVMRHPLPACELSISYPRMSISIIQFNLLWMWRWQITFSVTYKGFGSGDADYANPRDVMGTK